MAKRYETKLTTMLLSSVGLLVFVAQSLAADQDTPPAVKAKPKPVPEVPFFTVNDNRLTFEHIFHAIDAGNFSVRPNGTINGTTDMNVAAFTHFDVWAYGTNFFKVGVYKSGQNDPAAPCTNAGVITNPLPGGGTFDVAAACAGSVDIYSLIRSTFGLNEIFDTKAFSVGPLHGVSLEVGADADSQNSYSASAKRMFVGGLQFEFDLPYKGYIDIAPLWKTEQGHNAFTQCGSVFAAPAPGCNINGNMNFKDTWALEINYYMDLGFLPESIRYFAVSGRAGFYGPKGPSHGIAGGEPTKMEINSEPIRLTFDAGRAIGGKKLAHELDLWVAYRYWQNQYGDDANSTPFVCTLPTAGGGKISTNSCTTSSIATGVTLKF
jgi:hypothetical protein